MASPSAPQLCAKADLVSQQMLCKHLAMVTEELASFSPRFSCCRVLAVSAKQLMGMEHLRNELSSLKLSTSTLRGSTNARARDLLQAKRMRRVARAEEKTATKSMTDLPGLPSVATTHEQQQKNGVDPPSFGIETTPTSGAERVSSGTAARLMEKWGQLPRAVPAAAPVTVAPSSLHAPAASTVSPFLEELPSTATTSSASSSIYVQLLPRPDWTEDEEWQRMARLASRLLPAGSFAQSPSSPSSPSPSASHSSSSYSSPPSSSASACPAEIGSLPPATQPFENQQADVASFNSPSSSSCTSSLPLSSSPPASSSPELQVGFSPDFLSNSTPTRSAIHKSELSSSTTFKPLQFIQSPPSSFYLTPSSSASFPPSSSCSSPLSSSCHVTEYSIVSNTSDTQSRASSSLPFSVESTLVFHPAAPPAPAPLPRRVSSSPRPRSSADARPSGSSRLGADAILNEDALASRSEWLGGFRGGGQALRAATARRGPTPSKSSIPSPSMASIPSLSSASNSPNGFAGPLKRRRSQQLEPLPQSNETTPSADARANRANKQPRNCDSHDYSSNINSNNYSSSHSNTSHNGCSNAVIGLHSASKPTKGTGRWKHKGQQAQQDKQRTFSTCRCSRGFSYTVSSCSSGSYYCRFPCCTCTFRT
eukprot:GHVT01049715.1.p1 GENE.GHVT01049715.1~~GHVT01049715.1.p1  ORF type:complete len:651 (+),score=174.35 GHVT01049715.1:1133-3085(+)